MDATPREGTKMLKRFHLLSSEEEEILHHRGTESPFREPEEAGAFQGIYLCKQCDLPLFTAEERFFSPCGWPAFDGASLQGVVEKDDPDGMRKEVLCARCKGHLGHVFRGEGLTRNNIRFCINSVALWKNPLYAREGQERALYAAGCFWGVEYLIQEVPGVLQTTVGYTGGQVVYPTYEEVCTKKTGHLEAVEVTFSKKLLSYRTLTEKFFSLHDSAQKGGQGPDIGPQYTSAIFYLSASQKQSARACRAHLTRRKVEVATNIRPASRFYPAEQYHQNYYKKKGLRPYCHRWSDVGFS